MQMEVEAGKSIAIAGVQQQGGVLEGGAPLSDRSMAVGCVCCLSVYTTHSNNDFGLFGTNYGELLRFEGIAPAKK